LKYIEYRFETLPSTQVFLREKLSEGRDMLAVATEQTQGMGTKNRSFDSGKGGLWFSLLRFHENAPARDAFLMMARAAVAVCKTLEEYGLSPKIKWANDVLLDGKKVCGILTENRLQGDKIVTTLWGVGLNVNNLLSPELTSIATTMETVLGRAVDLRTVEEKLLAHFYGSFAFAEYSARLAYLGETVQFTVDGEPFEAVLEGVNERGELLLSVSGEVKRYAYGEITLRYKGRI
jgi:BirA family biotin operon repressor/biotin-[acetyl-CoA-carboxylase] ligase